MKKILILIGKLGVIVALCLGIFLGMVYLGVFGHVYNKKELREFKNETASLVLSDDGNLIGKFFADNRTNVRFDQLPEGLVNALVATEDARYFEHEGVDSRSLVRVLVKSILMGKKSSGGGSTITQQLAKNMFGRKDFGLLSMPVNKSKELILASRLEEIYSKEDILTLYLNTVPFGENVLGVESAARRYFNKGTSKLKMEESAVLVGLLKANTYYNPRLYPEHALSRRNVVLSQMEKYGYLDDSSCDSLQALPLVLDYANLESEGPASYFLVQVRKEAERILEAINKAEDTLYDLDKSGLVLETTLDLKLQNYALEAFRSHLGRMQPLLRREYASGPSRAELDRLVQKGLEDMGFDGDPEERRKRELFSWKGFYTDSISVRDSLRQALTLLQAGFIAVDPKDGEIKSWVGGIDFRTQPYDQVHAQRQTASAFKPILYASALEQGAGPCLYLDNEPIVLRDYESWQPQNYDRSTGGEYSMAASLAQSMNIPTVNLFLQMDPQALEVTWKDLGFSQDLVQEPSVALGTTTASLYEMALAYASFANGGLRVEPSLLRSIRTAEGKVLYKRGKAAPFPRVIKQSSAEMLTAMLRKAIFEGTGRALVQSYGVQVPVSGKTGTSQDYSDAWFLAYSPDLVFATRVGASFPAIHFHSGAHGSGSGLALPLVAKTMQKVQYDGREKKRYLDRFADLESYALAFDCEDFREDSKIEDLFEDIFQGKSTTYEKAAKKARKKAKRQQKGTWLQRLFGKKEK